MRDPPLRKRELCCEGSVGNVDLVKEGHAKVGHVVKDLLAECVVPAGRVPHCVVKIKVACDECEFSRGHGEEAVDARPCPWVSIYI
jgi:hypothetical protein